MEDRFTRGFIAGLVGAIAMNIWNYLSYFVLHLAKLHLFDYASIIILDHKSTTLLEKIVTQLILIGFSGVIGILLAYFLLLVTSKNYLLKGWIFSLAVWFAVFGFGNIYRLPHLHNSPIETIISNFISASIYGITTAIVLNWLDDRLKN